MKRRLFFTITLILLASLIISKGAFSQTNGSIGGRRYQCTMQEDLKGIVTVSSTGNHNLRLESDSGAVVAWGDNTYSQCEVPSPNSNFIAVVAKGYHILGLRLDGTIVAWGDNSYGQCNVPSSNSDFLAVAAGSYHSLGIKSDGVVVAWGDNYYGQCDVPSPNSDFIAVAAGEWHSLGLRLDGTIVAWGDNSYGQCDVPSPNSDFLAIAAGSYHSLGLKSDGTIIAWGSNVKGECDVPSPNSNFIAVAAGLYYSLGLKSDGTIVAWGFNNYGQCDVPSPNSNFLAIAAGKWHCLALRSDGTIVGWGNSNYGQCDVPSPNSNFIAVAAGRDYSLGIKGYTCLPQAIALDCPADSTVGPLPDYSTIELKGFSITNTSTVNLSFSYGVSTDGPATLDDNGKPASLSGTTPVLAPGQSFAPPPALLVLHPIHGDSCCIDQYIYYRVWANSCPGVVDTSVTTITINPPVATLFQSLDAEAEVEGVVLRWEIAQGERFKGFRIYRAAGGDEYKDIIGDLLSGETREYIDRSVRPGESYRYVVAAVMEDGSELRSFEAEVRTVAAKLALYQNKPNPFNPSTVISFTLPGEGRVRLEIYDIRGRLVRRLFDGVMQAGFKELIWDGRDDSGREVSSGIYFYCLKTEKGVLSRKMVLLR